ncbi:MAG: PAS domain S-box protein [Deferribacteres bacterium]|nr:PAS domain S-box protein [candidate division KSB1 bacterium]MCB9502137.1 PAS domain S-box protein [Deferribacteres bacterium]
MKSLQGTEHHNNLLLVNDTPSTRDDLKDLCERNGLKVHFAENSRDAIGIFNQNHFDVAVLQLESAEQNVIQLLTELTGINPELRAIVHTASKHLDDSTIRILKEMAFSLVENISNNNELIPYIDRAFRNVYEQYSHALEQKLTQQNENLHTMQDDFQEFYDNSPTMNLTLSVDGIIQQINLFGAQQLGYEKKELLGKHISVIIHPEDQKLLLAHLQSCQRNPGKLQRWEFRKVDKQGQIIWVREAARLLKKSTGEQLIFVACENITTHKMNEIDILESENKYRTLFEHSTDALLIIRGNKFVDCNSATIEMLGYDSKEELLETHPSQLSPPTQPDGRNSYEKADEMMTIAFEKGSLRFEWEHMRKNGDVFPVEVLLTAIPLQSESFLHVVWRDITERKLAEKALRKSEEKYRILVENAVELIIVAQNGIIEFINHRCFKLLGYHPEEMIGKLINNFIHPEDRAMVVERHLKRLRGEDVKQKYTFRIVDRAGSTKWVEINIVRLDWKGKPATLNFLSDITDRMQAEEEKAQLELQLRRSQKLETIGTLAGGIAHDFNNLLSPILGYSDMALLHLDESHHLYPDIQSIFNAARQAKQLVQQILTFSRQVEQERKPLALPAIIDETLQLLRPTLPVTIEIQKKIDENCSPVIADATQMHQVIMNLCTNAFHAMEKSGGTLKIELDQVLFDENMQAMHPNLKARDYLRLTVTDTGIGMDAITRDRIFEPFFSTKTGGKGTGLGLSVVHGIIRSHQGDITVQSERNKGTTFTIFLPALQSLDIETHKIVNPIRRGNERILLVDDENMIVQMLKQMLEDYGYTIYPYTNSQDALRFFHNQSEFVDLLITDLTMPIMTGLELIKAIQKVRPELPVIMITGYSESLNEEIYKRYGIREILAKPVLTAEISDAMRKLFDGEGNNIPE